MGRREMEMEAMGNRAAGGGQVAGLGVWKCSGQLPGGPGQLTDQGAERTEASQRPEGPQMLALKPEPLWIVLGPGDTSWAFLFGL